MESATLTTVPLLAFSKTLKPSRNPYYLHGHFARPVHSNQTLPARLASRCPHHQRSRECLLMSFSGYILRSSSPLARVPLQLACISSSAALSGSGRGGDDGVGGGSGRGGGDGGSSGEETETKSLSGESDDVAALGSDVIILDVGGMTCGGCAASVKRILESQPQVSSATVNLATETAVVWAIPEAKAMQNWQQQLGEKLANHLTTCGFKSNLRGCGHTVEGDIQS